MKTFRTLLLRPGVIAAASVTICAASPGCGPRPPDAQRGQLFAAQAEIPSARKPEKPLATKTGLASFYGAAGRAELFAAHPSYPMGTLVRVTNLENGREVVVRISDRGPTAAKQAEGLIIDVSRGAAEELDFIRAGIVRVRVEVLKWGGRRAG